MHLPVLVIYGADSVGGVGVALSAVDTGLAGIALGLHLSYDGLVSADEVTLSQITGLRGHNGRTQREHGSCSSLHPWATPR